jgi:hypothetical protein
MKRKIIAFGALVAALVAVALVSLSQSASATGDGPRQWTPTLETCNPGWYVNPDEQQLRPEQKVDGLLFDGPSLIHHQTGGALSSLNPGSFATKGSVVGALPLFKVETSAPYSTLNYVGDGTSNLWWSSRIPAGQDGGQGKPQTPTWFVAHAPYTAATTLSSFGVGYANDAGNKALVSSVTYGETYHLSCYPPLHVHKQIRPCDCKDAKTATVTLSLTANTKYHDDINVPYTTSNGLSGDVKLPKGKKNAATELSFSEDSGDGSVTITFGTGKHAKTATVMTDCAEAETPPSSTTTTPPPTSSTTSTSVGSTATTTDAVVPAGHADTGSKDDVGDLAYTGTSDQLPVLVWIGIGLVLVGGLTVFLYRQRSRRSGSHRS